MSYQLVVEFEPGKFPPIDDIRRVVRDFDPNATTLENNIMHLTDQMTGDSFDVVIPESPGPVTLQVPPTTTFRCLAAAYTLARAVAEKFGGTMRDPQLGGPPSLSLAQQEWRKHDPASELAKLFGGKIPSDLKTKIRQRRGLVRQEVEIRGSELEIRRRQPGRSIDYFIPILSLGNSNQRTMPNPRGILIVLLGLLVIIVGGVGGGSAFGGFFVLAGIAIITSSLVFYAKFRRQLLIIQGAGGNLILEMASPSKVEVREFLSSIDRVRFALARRPPTKPAEQTKEDEKMRVI